MNTFRDLWADGFRDIQLDEPRILLLLCAAGVLVFLLLLRGRRSAFVLGLRFITFALLLFALASPGKENSSSKSEIAAMADI